jgi:SAM-dependent methyltransferase
MFSESAELYDAIYGAFKDYAVEADAIGKVIRAHHPAAEQLLDVGCGTGEHVKHLRARGFLADGLDIDPKLLAVARRKVPDAAFFAADMADFELPHRYDVVACLFSSIGYLVTMPRVVAALRQFRRHLAPNGIVVIEPWFAPGVLRVGRGSTRRAVMGNTRVQRTSTTSVDDRVSRLVFDYQIESPEGVRHVREVHELGLFTADEMLAGFREAGLSATHDPVGIFDDRGLYVARVVP